jgi:hypothetical protein
MEQTSGKLQEKMITTSILRAYEKTFKNPASISIK